MKIDDVAVDRHYYLEFNNFRTHDTEAKLIKSNGLQTLRKPILATEWRGHRKIKNEFMMLSNQRFGMF
jgi:hypothetical protein